MPLRNKKEDHALRPPSDSRRGDTEADATMKTKEEEVSLQDQLLKALLNNDFNAFQEHLKNKRVNPNHYYGRPHHATCLQIAARRRYGAEYISLLLKYVKPNVNTIIPEPVHDAAKYGLSKVLKTLLSDKRTKPNVTDSKGHTALHYVCMHVTAPNLRNYEECVKLLMARFAPDDINRTNDKGFSAIHAAARSIPSTKNRKQSAKGNTDRKPEDKGENENVRAHSQIIRIILNLGRDVVDLDSVRAMGRTAREDILKFFPELKEELPTAVDARRADSHLALATAIRDGHFEIFRALLEETDTDGNPKLDPNHWFGSPQYATCLELACKKHNGENFVEDLLVAGADPNRANKINEKFPIHVACEKAHFKQLQKLFEFGKATNPNSRDRSGKTALHYVVDKLKTEKHLKKNMERCMEVLLQQKSTDVNIRNSDGLTALMVALEHNNLNAVDKILTAKRESVEMCAKYKDKEVRDVILELFPKLSDQLIKCGSPPPQEDTSEWFHLLQTMREDDFVERLDNTRPLNQTIFSVNDKGFTLLQRAAQYGMQKAVRCLLRNGADPNEIFVGNQSPPAVLACLQRKWEVVKIFLEHDDFDVNAVDLKGNTTLYYAARDHCHLETVVLLLHNGADITITNKLGKTPLGKEQVQMLLDQCVVTNKKNVREEDYQIIFDYRLLAPGRKIEMNRRNEAYVQVEQDDDVLLSEMDFLHMMRNDDELSTLFDHPVVFSFLELKWNRVKKLSYYNLVMYIAFMIFLNIHINTNDAMYNTATDSIWEYIYTVITGLPLFASIVLWCLILVREIAQCTLNVRKYFRTAGNYLDIFILLFSFIAIFLPMFLQDHYIINSVNVITIMLSCWELLVLLGRISYFAKYIEMLKVVLYNYLYPLLSYCVIIVAFGLSFHTLFHGRKGQSDLKAGNKTSEQGENIPKDFGTWYMSIIKSLVMMTGELEFDSYPDRWFLSVVLFVSFVLLVTVVLLNLLIGLAVSDTQKIESRAQRLRFQTRAELVRYSENILVTLHNSKCFVIEAMPRCLKNYLRTKTKKALLFPWRNLHGAEGKRHREGKVEPNKSANVVINNDTDDGDRHRLERELLDRVVSIISRRSERLVSQNSGKSVAAPAVTLTDVNSKLDKLLLTGGDNVMALAVEIESKLETVLKLLQGGRQSEAVRHRLPSRASLEATRLSDISNDEED